MGNRNSLILFVLGLLVVACSESAADSTSAPTVTVTDSAGIRIVENEDHGWAGTPWTLSAEPILTIGEFEGEEEYQLFRVVGALRLSNGNVLVANSGSYELRIYDDAGNYVSATGGEGSGPGEFEQMVGIRRYRGDSILAQDFRENRFSVFSPSGEFARSGTVDPPQGTPFAFVAAVTNDGRFIAQNSFAIGDEFPRGVSRRETTLYSYDPAGHVIDTVGSFPGGEVYRGGGPRSIGGVPFGKSVAIKGFENGVFVVATELYELKLVDLDSGLVRIIRKQSTPRPVEPEHVELDKAERRERLERLPESFRSFQEELIDEIPYAEVFPVISTVLSDTEGNLWVKRYDPPGEEISTYDIFDPDGVFLGPVSVPTDIRVLDIGADYLLASMTDDLDIEHVVMYELTK